MTQKNLDISIRTNNGYDQYKTSTIMNTVYKKVKELGGYMEYVGFLYNSNESNYRSNNKDININKGFKQGNYLVWLPKSDDVNKYQI